MRRTRQRMVIATNGADLAGESCAVMAKRAAAATSAPSIMARRREQRGPLHLDVASETVATETAEPFCSDQTARSAGKTAAMALPPPHAEASTAGRSAQQQQQRRIRQRARNIRPGGLLTLAASLLCTFSLVVRAQDAPTAAPTARVCACSPTVYRWSLNFTASCPPPDIKICPTCGVDDLFCDLKHDEKVTDLTPAVVESYTVLELDAGFQVIKQYSRGGLELTEGDEIDYVSITTGGDDVPVENRPAGLQMSMEGRNAAGEELQAQWIVAFTRLCDVLPFQDGDGISWSTFTDLVPPRPELCDVAPPLTMTPTSEPTKERTPEPTRSPTKSPTLEPTRSPTLEPTPPPSPAPTDEESTPSPTRAPATGPVQPTPSPTSRPTPKPTKKPTLTLAPLPTGPPKTPKPTPRPDPSPVSTPAPSVMSMGYGGGADLTIDWPMDDLDELASSSAESESEGRSSKKKSRKRGASASATEKKDSMEGGHTDLSERSRDKNKKSGFGSDSGSSSGGSSTDEKKKKKPTKRGRSRKKDKTHSHSSSSSSKRESRKRKKHKSSSSSKGSSSSHKKSHKHKHSKSKGSRRLRQSGTAAPLPDNASELFDDGEYLKHADYAVEGFDAFDVMRLEVLDAAKRVAADPSRGRRERGWKVGAERKRR